MADVFNDGNFTAPSQVSPWLIETDDTGALSYSAEFVVAAASFAFIAAGTELTGKSAFLVSESKPSSIGGGLVSYTRTYSQVPQNVEGEAYAYGDYSSYAYEFPGYLEGFSSSHSAGRGSFTKTVVARIDYTYTKTNDPTSITLLQAQGYWGSGGVGFPVEDKQLGDVSSPTKDHYIDNIIGTWIVAESSSLKEWKKGIYERRTVYVKAI